MPSHYTKRIIAFVFQNRATGFLLRLRLQPQRNRSAVPWVKDNPKTWKLDDQKTAAGFELFLPND